MNIVQIVEKLVRSVSTSPNFLERNGAGIEEAVEVLRHGFKIAQTRRSCKISFGKDLGPGLEIQEAVFSRLDPESSRKSRSLVKLKIN